MKSIAAVDDHRLGPPFFGQPAGYLRRPARPRASSPHRSPTSRDRRDGGIDIDEEPVAADDVIGAGRTTEARSDRIERAVDPLAVSQGLTT